MKGMLYIAKVGRKWPSLYNIWSPVLTPIDRSHGCCAVRGAGAVPDGEYAPPKHGDRIWYVSSTRPHASQHAL